MPATKGTVAVRAASPLDILRFEKEPLRENCWGREGPPISQDKILILGINVDVIVNVIINVNVNVNVIVNVIVNVNVNVNVNGNVNVNVIVIVNVNVNVNVNRSLCFETGTVVDVVVRLRRPDNNFSVILVEMLINT